jgi:two-component system, LytTR family, sensor kinase
LALSLLQTKRFRIGFAVWLTLWAALHYFALRGQGLSRTTAGIDSLLSNVLLGGAVLLVALTLQFYLPAQSKYSYLLGLCVSLSLLWLVAVRTLLFLLLDEGEEYSSFFSQSLLIRGATGFLTVSCGALVSVVWYTLQDSSETERRRAEADGLARAAELNNLRQQLQPHFLFNSLNSINALVVAEPQKARQMIQQLSQFLRGTLKKEQSDWIALEEEIEHLQLYLDIEKVRFGHRLSTQINNEAPDASLPVMLLQPVVENAIKFGLYDTTGEVTIRIMAKQEAGVLHLQVANPFDAETSSPKKGTGFGLSSVQRRLYLLFARNDLLQTETKEGQFITTIKIPQP